MGRLDQIFAKKLPKDQDRQAEHQDEHHGGDMGKFGEVQNVDYVMRRTKLFARWRNLVDKIIKDLFVRQHPDAVGNVKDRQVA